MPTRRFVEALCARNLKFPSHTRTVDTQAHAATHRQTLEEAARNLRYLAFSDLMQSGAATHILTAHTLDDQAETVLIKLLRGAWLEGLSAIAPSLPLASGKVLRPLLQTPRADLRTYLKPAISRGAKTLQMPTKPSPAIASATPSSRSSARKTLRSTIPSPTSPRSPARKKHHWAARARSPAPAAFAARHRRPRRRPIQLHRTRRTYPGNRA